MAIYIANGTSPAGFDQADNGGNDAFAPVVWAAAYARLGIASVANEAVDFAQRHFPGTPEGLLNHEQMWLDTTQKWASGQDWRLV